MESAALASVNPAESRALGYSCEWRSMARSGTIQAAPPIPNGVSMKTTAFVFAAAALVASGAVHAAPVDDLLTKSGCTACHANDKKIVGPAYNEVAAKYKGDAGAAAKLADKV